MLYRPPPILYLSLSSLCVEALHGSLGEGGSKNTMTAKKRDLYFYLLHASFLYRSYATAALALSGQPGEGERGEELTEAELRRERNRRWRQRREQQEEGVEEEEASTLTLSTLMSSYKVSDFCEHSRLFARSYVDVPKSYKQAVRMALF